MEYEELKREFEILRAQVAEWTRFVPPGHFYSPVPALAEVRAGVPALEAEPPAQLAGIKLDARRQLRLMKKLSRFLKDPPFAATPPCATRYYCNNPNFYEPDGMLLHAMLRQVKPKRVIEIGSGYSSAMVLDTNERFFDWGLDFTAIEPYPELLRSLLRPGDQERVQIVGSKLQEVPLRTFGDLRAGDILFVDSTHVSRFNSDVNYIFFEILPSLAKGVYVHIHDVFYPFEYPKEWLLDGRAWNEDYLLRAFLQYNRDFEIVVFIDYLRRCQTKSLKAIAPLFVEKGSGCFWMKRV